MKKKFTFLLSWILMITTVMMTDHAYAFGPRHKIKNDTLLHYSLLAKKPVKKKSLLSFSFPPFKAGSVSSVKLNMPPPPQQSDKLLSGVEVYPNPITDHINLKYNVSRYSMVNINLMDVLGNKIATLVSERVEPGEKTVSYAIGNGRISKGFYLIRIAAGTETVTKRVSIL